MSLFYQVNGIGDVYLPASFRAIVPDDAPLKLFTNGDLGQLDRIFTYLRRGGVAILSGEWERVTAVMTYIDRKQNELIRPSQQSKGKRNAGSKIRRTPEADGGDPMFRLMCWADQTEILQVNPLLHLPYLFELVGENPGANEGHPFLIPVVVLQKIQNALGETYSIDALGMSLLALTNVFPPRSQETIQLFQRGLRSVKTHLPAEATVLDMGCGCGVLTLLAAQELGEPGVTIHAADMLPEAVATTRLNLRRFIDARTVTAEIDIIPVGDLFQPVAGACFDLIIFNAPWVVSRARNRAELAIHDEKQATLRRFFHDAPSYLKAEGRILVGYADASGLKAISNLETMIEAAAFAVVNRFRERVATHRSKGKWENVTVYELMHHRAVSEAHFT